MTIRLQDDKNERLTSRAKANKVSDNKRVDELATVALANFDAKTGNAELVLQLFDKFED